MTKFRTVYVISNEVRDLLKSAWCLHWEILHCVQDDEISEGIRHLERSERSPEIGMVPAFGDPSLR
ncbi:hypothetical protein, partial [Legionella bononiensis]|uniref:hypothetical protein n=1 Tax=Legionella bononiensis TaxID=2793102 RepID=UPI001EE3BC5E